MADPVDIAGLEGDEAGTLVVQEELRLLATVTLAMETAQKRQATEEETRTADDARLLELRDDVSVAKPEDLPALFEQMHNLGALRAQRGKSASGVIDRMSPYFGHLRLVEDGRRRDVLIGSRSYLDPAAGVRIVDWRNAPVSRIFYRYQEGEDYEEQLGDRLVEGNVMARRTVAILKGELVRVSTPQGTFSRGADGRWKRIETTRARLRSEPRPESETPRLGVGADGELRTDKLLPAIAAMLDPAQFELIARPSAGLVAIQGSAGSGKTTVGLHRAAYLAFADARRFRPDRMMVVVPNDALRQYVAHVLPSLGVEGVPVTTFGRLATRITLDLFPRLPSNVSEDTPPVVSRAKSHPAMLHAINALQKRVLAQIDARVREAMEKWPDGQTVVRAWDASKDASTPDQRVTALALWVSGKRALGERPASSLPEVTRGALEKLGHDLRQLSRSVNGSWDELLTSRERLAETFAGVPTFGPGQLDQVLQWCVRQTRVRAESDRDGESPSIDAEDRAMLLRIWQVLRGPLVDAEGNAYRLAHLFVDEVQDASPVELRVLLDLADKDQSITLAGDVAQRMLDDDDGRGEFHWEDLLRELELPLAKLEPLKVSYRSTAEITRFARSVLGPLAHDAEPIATRHGPPVELFPFGSQGEAVAFLADALKQLAQDEPNANVALVARFPQQADVYYEGLVRAEVPGVRRVSKQDFTWEPGFEVTDIRQTKGLEFDEVVLLETNAATFPDTAPARHALYVGATRAAHQLWCITSERPSPVVAAAIAASDG